VVCAVPSAARGQIYLGAKCKSEHRRNQRKAEEEEQRERENTSHTAIVASFVGLCVS